MRYDSKKPWLQNQIVVGHLLTVSGNQLHLLALVFHDRLSSTDASICFCNVHTYLYTRPLRSKSFLTSYVLVVFAAKCCTVTSTTWVDIPLWKFLHGDFHPLICISPNIIRVIFYDLLCYRTLDQESGV